MAPPSSSLTFILFFFVVISTSFILLTLYSINKRRSTTPNKPIKNQEPQQQRQGEKEELDSAVVNLPPHPPPPPLTEEKRKKKKGKKQQQQKQEVEEEEAADAGRGAKCPYPFSSFASAMQRKIKAQYDDIVKSNEAKSLSIAQVGQFVNCLVDARNELQHKYEIIQRSFKIQKALLVRADRSSFDRHCQQMYKLEKEHKRLEEDAAVYNLLQEQLKLSPAYKMMLEISARFFVEGMTMSSSSSSSSSWGFLLFFALLSLSSTLCLCDNIEEDVGLQMNFYKDSCPQAEDIIREQVKLLYKRHKNTAFSWLRNIFHDCAVESCDASLLLDSTRRELSEKETDRSFGLRNFRYLDTIKEAVERECPDVVSCSDILVLSARDGIVSVGGPYIPLKTGRRDGRRSRADVLEQYLPDHNESISAVLDKFGAMGIDTPGVVALLGAHSVGRTHCVKLVHRLYPEVDSDLNPDHIPHMLKKCPDAIPDPKAVQYVRNDRGTPMKLDNNYYNNILDNKGLLLVDHQLAYDSRTRPYVKKMAKSQDYFFKEFSRAITILSENNPLTGTKGEIRKQCNVANKH